MPIAFTLTYDDILAGNTLAIRRSLRKAAPRYALGLTIAAMGVSVIAFAIKPSSFAELLLLFGKIFALYIILAAAIFLLAILFTPKLRAKKNMKQMRALTYDQTVAWDETSISFSSDYGNARIPIIDLHQWSANDGIVIIYPADHLFYMIPSRVFADRSDWDSLITALQNSKVQRI
jgi:hypothetical protein